MTKLNVTLSSVLKKLGVDITTSKAQELLGNAALASIDVPDDISNALNKDFYTLDSALQNPDIISKARAEALNGIDTLLESIWENSGLDGETVTQLKGEKKTAVRLSKTIETIREKEKEANKAFGEDKKKLVEEINKLNQKVAEETKKFQKDLEDEKNARKMDKVNWELDSIYNSFDYASPMEKDLSVHAAKAVIAKMAAQKDLKFVLTDKGVSLKTNIDTDYVEDNRPLTPKDFITKTLIENKFVKVNGQGNNGQSQQQNQQNIHQAGQGANGSGKKDNAYLQSIRADIQKNPLPQ